jgi:hypothetical protein
MVFGTFVWFGKGQEGMGWFCFVKEGVGVVKCGSRVERGLNTRTTDTRV